MWSLLQDITNDVQWTFLNIICKRRDSKSSDASYFHRNIIFSLWNSLSPKVDQPVSYFSIVHSDTGYDPNWCSDALITKIITNWYQYVLASEGHVYNCRYLKGWGQIPVRFQANFGTYRRPVSKY